MTPVAGGSITFRGESLVGRPAHRSLRVGIAHVPQGWQIFGDQTLEDNLLLGGFGQYFRDRHAVRKRLQQRICCSASMIRTTPRASG